ncbi:MAG: tetratricopeptide repeat protein [Proteiniphilum sp.]|jgi:tetratricopeptide (TPR) repeat protein|nr:tetratricopeptide repeat protein [Proteiniphilum sp.]NCD14097.1 tetratricopeptide repeat protein [Bacteroidia bacterium]MDD2727261.1 tetratricopeptide repeat protein [Proteiniphilum sp.]MDD3333213.1 tetratricopeptide repeat protein [Proteiniphilum sp.]MDD3556900.1 tetratricopeptide repeat protein [Proteiniphilum sp.]
MSAKKHKETQAEKNFENIGEALTSSEQFLEKNQKSILTGLLIVVVLVGAYLAYHYLYKVPRNEKAQAALFRGEQYFQGGEDSLALFGNGNDFPGFEAVISQYKGTRSADLAHAYAGISYNRMGNNEKALDHLRKFKGGDLLLTPAITGAIGDVYMNMGESDKAIGQYMKAAKEADDQMLSPLYLKKAGNAHLQGGDYDKAIELFTRIKTEYTNSAEGQEADKYITQAELLKESK